MENKIKIWFGRDTELRDALLRKMEENGVLWKGGAKPTSLIPGGACYYIENQILTYGTDRDFFDNHRAKDVSPSEYLSMGTGSELTFFSEEEFLSLLS